ncbi:hypothetical protein OEA41_007099 [Lepraria neglecta]|uniref:Uncharacterized protein n=1 Tax=Lepraria neglecta TaxID=209136 RepID=A0AAD9ZCE7_9LECA|nr:hypothetical protein OEA41_007099 [Lepraria neglecta]
MHIDRTVQKNIRQTQLLSLQSDTCVQLLETLEEGMNPTEDDVGPVTSRRSIRSLMSIGSRMSLTSVDIARSARWTRDSILSLYGHQSYYEEIMNPREGNFVTAVETQADPFRVSMIIEDHISRDSSSDERKHGVREEKSWQALIPNKSLKIADEFMKNQPPKVGGIIEYRRLPVPPTVIEDPITPTRVHTADNPHLAKSNVQLYSKP